MTVPGHAPTNIFGNPWALEGSLNGDGAKYRFGQPGAPDPRNSGQGRPATAEQRYCMEAVQRLPDLDDKEAVAKLRKRYPHGMVKRLVALQKAAEDPNGPFFLQAQREIYRITVAPVRRKEIEEEGPKATEIIEVRVGRVEVPMPGAPGDIAPKPETKAG